MGVGAAGTLAWLLFYRDAWSAIVFKCAQGLHA
jgi:hypothetical protein